MVLEEVWGATGMSAPSLHDALPIAAGAQGPTGPAGMVWRQAWDSGTNYAVNDAVQYNGASYISIQAGIGQTPGTAAVRFWSLLRAKGATGAGDAHGPQGPQGLQGLQ